MRHSLVGFGFGPIQAALFAAEARCSGRFDGIAVAEVDAALVAAVRGNGTRYCVNVAGERGIGVAEIADVALLNPADARDRALLNERLDAATEVVTALPSVRIFDAAGAASVAALIARGLRGAAAPATLIYAAENHNHAAEILERCVRAVWGEGVGPGRPCQFLNTVIGKMSQVISDPEEIDRRSLVPIAPGFPRAFLVEEFNRILVTKAGLPGFSPGIGVFEEKADLLPFEQAKLYGHNAVHALLGFLLWEQGETTLSAAAFRPALMEFAAAAFLEESGAALCRKYRGLDPLFTAGGFRAYAEDLLRRMVNPHLADAVQRVTRDPLRKLGWDDRLIGTMRMARDEGIEPKRFAVAARAAIAKTAAEQHADGDSILASLWQDAPARDRADIARMISAAGI